MKNISIPKSDVSGLVWPAIPSGGGTMILAILGQINESQWWPEQTIRHLQFVQLEALLNSAVENVPYYQSILNRPDARQKMSDYFSGIPILQRQTVIDQFDLLQNTKLPKEHGAITDLATTGSTGEAVKVRHSEMFTVFEGCSILRHHNWHNRNFMGKLATFTANESLWQNNLKQGEILDWGWPITLIYPSGATVAFKIDASVASQVAWIQQENPDYLLTAPAIVQNIARYCLQHNIRFENLKNINTLMATVSHELRQLCRDVLNAPIIDVYSCKEVGTIASQCPDCDDYHVCAENVLVEILDETGLPCRPGEAGRVVVTSLRNFAMPLIRYDVGDYAILGEQCACGRGLPVLKQIKGRIRNMLKLKNGERRWANFNRLDIQNVVPVRQFQFIQTSWDTIEIWMTTLRPVTSEEENNLKALLQRNLPQPFIFNLVYVDEISYGPGGKFEDFICHM